MKEEDKYYFDEEAADKVVRFFEDYLRHTKGKWAGKAFKLVAWQIKLLRNLFGWKKAADHSRRYRTCYCEVPRKNGKTTLASGIALYLLLCDGEMGAEVYCCGTGLKTSNLAFDIAKNMILCNEELSNRVQAFKTNLFVPASLSKLESLAADPKRLHGLNASGLIIDEIHAWKDREVYEVLKTSTGARDQPLTFIITTAGYDKTSIAYELHEHAEKISEGIIEDDSFYPCIYAADKEDDWAAEETWAKANPNYGITISKDYFETECNKAKLQPNYENAFRRLHLNQWTEQCTRWISLKLWEKNGGTVDIKELKGRTCYAGLDLANKLDLAAITFAFPNDDGGYDLFPMFFMPQDNLIQKEQNDSVSYSTWIREGFIESIEGSVIDYDVIRKRINEYAEIFDIKQIAVDRWDATQLIGQLESDGLDVVTMGQGMASMSSPSKEFERLLVSQRINHGDNPVLRWQASNVEVKTDEHGNIKPVKSSTKGKVDGIICSIMAIDRAIKNNDTQEESVYETRGIRFV